MNPRDYLRPYLLKRIHELEMAKRSKGIAPDHVSGRDLRGAFLNDIERCLSALCEAGLLVQGDELNDIYFNLTSKGADNVWMTWWGAPTTAPTIIYKQGLGDLTLSITDNTPRGTVPYEN